MCLIPESLFLKKQGQHRSSARVSSGGLVGVGDHIKGRTGYRGNMGEPTVSTRKNAAYGQPRDQLTGLLRELAAPVVMIRTSSKR